MAVSPPSGVVLVQVTLTGATGASFARMQIPLLATTRLQSAVGLYSSCSPSTITVDGVGNFQSRIYGSAIFLLFSFNGRWICVCYIDDISIKKKIVYHINAPIVYVESYRDNMFQSTHRRYKWRRMRAFLPDYCFKCCHIDGRYVETNAHIDKTDDCWMYNACFKYCTHIVLSFNFIAQRYVCSCAHFMYSFRMTFGRKFFIQICSICSKSKIIIITKI